MKRILAKGEILIVKFPSTCSSNELRHLMGFVFPFNRISAHKAGLVDWADWISYYFLASGSTFGDVSKGKIFRPTRSEISCVRSSWTFSEPTTLKNSWLLITFGKLLSLHENMKHSSCDFLPFTFPLNFGFFSRTSPARAMENRFINFHRIGVAERGQEGSNRNTFLLCLGALNPSH